MEEREAARAAYADEVGRYFEGMSLSPTAGRVVGWLLTAGADGASPGELASAVGAAKSSVSVALQKLELLGLVVRVRPPGTRRDRFAAGEDVFGGAFRAKMAELRRFEELAAHGLQLVGDDPVPRQRLERMRDLYAFMARRFPELLDEWEAIR